MKLGPIPGANSKILPVEVSLTPQEFARIARIAYSVAGIFMSESKQPLVYSRLIRRLRQLSCGSFSDYCDIVEAPNGEDERKLMVSALMTHTTRFFREDHHFKFLRDHVLPPIIAAARKGARVRIWSAGCSSGEEVYTILFSLLQICADAASLDIKILATDIDRGVLDVAEEASYPVQAVAQIDPGLVSLYFIPSPRTPGNIQVKPEFRSLISFRELNLNQTWPVNGPFDIVFCRNVAIYFDAEVQERLWGAFKNVLRPGGYLFIGHSERLSSNVKDHFDITGLTTYRLKGGAKHVENIMKKGAV